MLVQGFGKYNFAGIKPIQKIIILGILGINRGFDGIKPGVANRARRQARVSVSVSLAERNRLLFDFAYFYQ